MTAHAQDRTGRKRPKDVILRGDLDWIAKETMSYFLSREFQSEVRRYKRELLEKPLPEKPLATKDELKFVYYDKLLKSLRNRYGIALDDIDPPLAAPLSDEEAERDGYVSSLPMSELEGKVKNYVNSIFDSKYAKALHSVKELTAMTMEERQQALQKEDSKETASQKPEKKRGRANKKINRYR